MEIKSRKSHSISIVGKPLLAYQQQVLCNTVWLLSQGVELDLNILDLKFPFATASNILEQAVLNDTSNSYGPTKREQDSITFPENYEMYNSENSTAVDAVIRREQNISGCVKTGLHGKSTLKITGM